MRLPLPLLSTVVSLTTCGNASRRRSSNSFFFFFFLGVFSPFSSFPIGDRGSNRQNGVAEINSQAASCLLFFLFFPPLSPPPPQWSNAAEMDRYNENKERKDHRARSATFFPPPSPVQTFFIPPLSPLFFLPRRDARRSSTTG